jgi:hypothetical protein
MAINALAILRFSESLRRLPTKTATLRVVAMFVSSFGEIAKFYRLQLDLG